MNHTELIAEMNKNREQINLLEAQDWELGEALLNTISSEEECLFVLKNLIDSVTRMYVADKLRMIRHTKVNDGAQQS